MERERAVPDMAENMDIQDRMLPLIRKYRERCLWHLREDFVPGTVSEASAVLDLIEKHGDREAFLEAREIKTWLSRNFSTVS
jgi:hypothetical protein